MALARSSSASFRATSASRAPSLASSRAITNPRPREPPVIKTTLPWNEYRFLRRSARRLSKNAPHASPRPNAEPTTARECRRIVFSIISVGAGRTTRFAIRAEPKGLFDAFHLGETTRPEEPLSPKPQNSSALPRQCSVGISGPLSLRSGVTALPAFALVTKHILSFRMQIMYSHWLILFFGPFLISWYTVPISTPVSTYRL